MFLLNILLVLGKNPFNQDFRVKFRAGTILNNLAFASNNSAHSYYAFSQGVVLSNASLKRVVFHKAPPSDKHSLFWLASWPSALWLAEHHKRTSEI